MMIWSNRALDALLAGLRDGIDAATEPGQLALHALPVPATPGGSGGTEQARITLTKPCGSITAQALQFGLPLETLRSGGEQIGWARLSDGAGRWLADCSVGVTGSGESIQLDNLAGYPGGTVQLTAAAIGF